MALKVKTVYICKECGAESPKWMGRCSQCGEWNTFVEEQVTVGGGAKQQQSTSNSISSATIRPMPLAKVQVSEVSRTSTANAELDRVLGGGIVPGALILIGGEPGIGKSTLVLQMALSLPNRKVLYVSGEESTQQIKLRADRLTAKVGSATADNCMVVSDTSIDRLQSHIDLAQPDLIVIDSIQTMETERVDSFQGSISQIKECTSMLMHLAKSSGLPIILIGHINKDGQIAGPKILEHMVDVVLQFEGDRNHMYRILRSIKNRFGSTNEIGIFEMLGDGLREVSNPSELLLNEYSQSLSGVSVAAAMEGMRPFLIEVQALASTAAYGTPQRSATGFDVRRLNMLLAVLEKRAGFKLAAKDVFLNIAGGIKVVDPAIDLAVVSSILSSNTDIAINQGVCLAGEIGLSGEIRPINRIEQRVGEASKLGFKSIIIPKYGPRISFKKFDIEVKQVCRLDEAFRLLFQ